MREKIYEIPQKLTVQWDSEINAIIDTWVSYGVELAQFKEAIIDNAVVFASKKKVKSWIVDSSNADGAFSQEIQSFIGSTIFPKFAEIGVKNFITVTSSKSAITKMTVKSYSAKTGPCGLQLVEVNSLNDAIDWIKSN